MSDDEWEEAILAEQADEAEYRRQEMGKLYAEFVAKQEAELYEQWLLDNESEHTP